MPPVPPLLLLEAGTSEGPEPDVAAGGDDDVSNDLRRADTRPVSGEVGGAASAAAAAAALAAVAGEEEDGDEDEEAESVVDDGVDDDDDEDSDSDLS